MKLKCWRILSGCFWRGREVAVVTAEIDEAGRDRAAG